MTFRTTTPPWSTLGFAELVEKLLLKPTKPEFAAGLAFDPKPPFAAGFAFPATPVFAAMLGFPAGP